MSPTSRIARITSSGGTAERMPAHGVDDLVHGDAALDARQRHIRAGHGDYGARRVALYAGNLHKPGNRVADQPEHGLDGDGRRVADGLRVAAAQIAQRRRAHRAGRADFRLTAARRARDGRFGRDDLTDCARDIHRAHHRLVAQPLALLIRQQHRGHDAAASGGGRGDDALHTGVVFPHFQRLRNHLPQFVAADRLSRLDVAAHLRAVSARHAAGRTQRRRVILRRMLNRRV